ncbi:uncharacterized protein LOC123674926 isoform X3 [Harmonia axyridis]|uniref:uncharacterized protein LOC123674926 isoform X3 n=1 Tax=Harmonia axyridis TaxID=115357 RepID=UPI001E277C44|nr:uncharacterized protein LOC123674926 isoform X3 [Harmonia axyridis]
MRNEETESVGRALDCLGPRQPTGPFHYLINEQAKSLLALQELQHEVGALLEFRDLVIETFPSLRTKLSSTPSAVAQMAHHGGPNRTDWVPGVRVRRKLGPKKNDAVPDSGFSTETSSKDTHSAASSTATAATSAGAQDETEDELWSLLDLIHRKGTRLKDEVEALQDQLQQQHTVEDVRDAVFRSNEDVDQVRRERDELKDRMVELEAEVVAGRIHTSRLQEDMEQLLATKQDLEEQLRVALDEKGEVNSRIHDLHAQFVTKSDLERGRSILRTPSARTVSGGAKCTKSEDECDLDRTLGADVPKVRFIDNAKFCAILAEKNPSILQKHLLTSTVQNEILLKQLESATKVEVDLVDKLSKVREENEELKFQLEDKSIELEGTRAQVRVLEQLQKGCPHDGPDVIPSSTLSSSTPTRGEILSASMKNMSPIPMTLQIDHSSSTESAHDQTESNKRTMEGSRRKPSKIPLKSYTAPKPPGRGKSHSSARSRSGDSPGRPHSAQSTRGGARSEANSLQGPASKGGSSLPKSRNGSLVTSKDSLSSKLRSSDSLSKLSNASSSFGNTGRGTLRKSSTSNTKDQPTADKVDLGQEKYQFQWSPSSFEGRKVDYLDSLDPNSFSHRSMTDSSSHKFQTANTFTWNRTREYYDSIDSNLSSSLYQQNGEELAECDSLEKHMSGNTE